jgi:hypothetical protein
MRQIQNCEICRRQEAVDVIDVDRWLTAICLDCLEGMGVRTIESQGYLPRLKASLTPS